MEPRKYERLDLTTAEPGIYAVRSTSPTVYYVDVVPGGVHMVMRDHAGAETESRSFEGDNVWWRLHDIVSGPDLRDPAAIDPTDMQVGVLRVGSRHRFTWDGGWDQWHWRVSRVALEIEGPIDLADLADPDDAEGR